MNVDTRGMRTGLAAVAVLGVILWALSGCGGTGGSGSSGFDVSPVTSESQAITRAIDRKQCVDFGQQTFCASGAKAGTPDLQGASVIIKAPADSIVCDGNTAGQQCTASLEFTAEGFMVQNTLLAAVSETEDGPWTLVPLAAADTLTGPREVSITVPGRADAPSPTPLIAAVLVFVGEVPESTPQSAAHLADFSGVDVVYVSSRLELVVPH